MLTAESKIEAALGYAALGWRVVPLHAPALVAGAVRCSCGRDDCPSPAKHPRTPRGLHDATADTLLLREWWRRWPGANVGVVTGADSGIVVLDVDGGEGAAALDELEGEFGEFPETPAAETGGGGKHIFFAHPGGTLPNSARRVGPGLDVRGDGGYVVAAPSGHASGRAYRWLVSPSDCSPAAVPAWLLAKMAEPPKPPPGPARGPTHSDTARHWLGKALARCGVGTRNDTGLWLACQLRDAGLSRDEAESIAREYAQRCPVGGEAYGEREAVASVASAYRTAPRDPAASRSSGSAPRMRPNVPPPPPGGADAELRELIGGIVGGTVYNVPWPWPRLTHLTSALLPGTVTTVCGDTGVGKTFWVLQCLRDWHANGHPASVFFVEKDRKFHTHRLLAQLEADGRYIDYDWIKANGERVLAAVDRHGPYLRELGTCIYSAPADRLTLQDMLAWVREQCAHRKRVIVIDPVTAVSAGKDRFIEDHDFVVGAQAAVTAAGASLILVTHSKKANRVGTPTEHDISLGAAYSRFVDNVLWLVSHKDERPVRVKTALGDLGMSLKTFCQIHKARNARGRGVEIGFVFGPDLLYAEQGIVAGKGERGTAA